MSDVWFANQVPEYACASIAILNLVNNIPGLDLGKELRDFKDFTQSMGPLTRGDTIDSFDFVKRVHNSFARETDMLNADTVTQGKVNEAKKRLAQQKARETREAKKAERESAAETTMNVAQSTTNGSHKPRRPTARQAAVAAKTPTPAGNRATTVASDPSDTSEDPDHDYAFKAKSEASEVLRPAEQPRRSARVPKPRGKVITDADFEEPDAGYHYVTYVPIGNNVWKLDGMDSYPQDLGPFQDEGSSPGGDSEAWLKVASPIIQDRLDQNDRQGKFVLMAVVRDPYFNEQKQLLENIRTLRAVDDKLGSLDAEWTLMEGGETSRDVLTGILTEFEISQKDIDDAQLPTSAEKLISNEDDLLKLIKYRQDVLQEQKMLRSGVRDAQRVPQDEEEAARLRKFDYGPFVKGWLNALAEKQVLEDLIHPEGHL